MNTSEYLKEVLKDFEESEAKQQLLLSFNNYSEAEMCKLSESVKELCLLLYKLCETDVKTVSEF